MPWKKAIPTGKKRQYAASLYSEIKKLSAYKNVDISQDKCEELINNADSLDSLRESVISEFNAARAADLNKLLDKIF
jgi:hypothetical protein